VATPYIDSQRKVICCESVAESYDDMPAVGSFAGARSSWPGALTAEGATNVDSGCTLGAGGDMGVGFVGAGMVVKVDGYGAG
jgi:hypothetical protein